MTLKVKVLRQGQIKITLRRCKPTPPNQCPTMYQLPMAYGSQDIAWTRF